MLEDELKRASSGLSEKSVVKRPVILTIFCILGLFYTVLTLRNEIYFEPLQFFKFHDLKGVFPLLLATMRIIGLVGYWMMREWGVGLFSISFIFGIAYAALFYKIAPAEIDFWRLIIPLMIVIVGIANLNKMR